MNLDLGYWVKVGGQPLAWTSAGFYCNRGMILAAASITAAIASNNSVICWILSLDFILTSIDKVQADLDKL